ncbi:MAG: ParB/RepB/Spo0J family partition protein [Candidatus Omnitrophica bacterium]|nr:ParB/RepB/Spo0J family partition protein [Candidatus Omnitrophota bacterium]
MEKKALGKGLSALIPERVEETHKNVSDSLVNVNRIKPNPFQPRENFDKKRLDELVQSIREKGVIQPVIVREKDGDYELIAGERRLRAAKELDLTQIPIIVKEVSDVGALELSLIENIQREELNAIEEAKAFNRLMNEFGFNQEEVARAVGKDRTTISNTIRLLGLPRRVQELVSNNELTMGHARALLALTGEHTIMKLANRVVRNGLSVRETENIVSRKKAMMSHVEAPKTRDHKVMFFEEELQRFLGTKVKIQHGKKRGKIVVDYFTLEDLERVYNLIKMR